jgi:uncharacterized membrane protein YbhN (UPF0104 family)
MTPDGRQGDVKMHTVTTLGLALAAGLHAALYGAWKDSPFESFKPGSFMRELLIATFVGVALCQVLWSLLFSLHLPCMIGRAALMEGVVKSMNAAASFVPGQIGVAEGTYAVMFNVFGLPAGAGVTISFARRLRSLITALIGLIALGSLRGRPQSGQL